MNNVAPIANWIKPEVLPEVELYEVKTFWVAVKTIRTDRAGTAIEKQFVFPAQYVNKPLILDGDGDYENDDYFVNEDGEPVSCIGWHSEMDSSEFDGWYPSLPFSDEYILLGWAEYLKPEFK